MSPNRKLWLATMRLPGRGDFIVATETRAAVPVDAIASGAGDVDRDGRFPADAVAELARSGLLGLGLPEPYGGLAGGPVDVVEVVEQVAGACASTGMVFVMHLVAAQTLLAGTRDGDDGPKGRALHAMAHGRHLSTLAYSERGSRGHFWAQVSRAQPSGGGLVIDADKTFATSAGHVDSYVLATGAPGESDALASDLYLVDGDAPGLEVAARFDGLGLRGNASAPLRVRGLQVGDDRRLGEPASGLALMMTATLPWFALGSAACSVGIAQTALDAARAHATGASFEHLAGSALADVPGVRARLAQAYLRVREARALLHEVARHVAEGDPAAQLGVLAVKASAAEAAVEATDLAMRVGGGAAYARRGSLERHFRDARAASVMAPTTDLLHDFLGRALTGRELL
jgi:alkylation response protein AidB-like acyl-CoA dehydrogenase